MKILITGTFCSGKTTLAEGLKEAIKESALIEEPARELITNLPTCDWSRIYIRNYLIVRQLLVEKIAEKNHRYIIVDAGIESNFAHNQLFNSEYFIDDILDMLSHNKYDYVFFCDHQEIEYSFDGFRIQDTELREKLAMEILKVLKSLKYNPIFIFGSVEERIDTIQKAIKFR